MKMKLRDLFELIGYVLLGSFAGFYVISYLLVFIGFLAAVLFVGVSPLILIGWLILRSLGVM